MLGGRIAAAALGEAGKRSLPSEQAGPRPAAVAGEAIEIEPRAARATKP